MVNDCTDDTKEIAHSYGVQVYEEPWHGHREQKNIALGYAEQPWILALDSDEVVSEKLKSSIIRFVDEDSPGKNGAAFNRCTFFMDRWIKHGDWYPDRKLRLIRKDKGEWQGVMEHDKMSVEGESVILPGDLLHYSFEDIQDHLFRQPVYAEAFLKRQKDTNARWSPLNMASRAMWRFFRAYFLRLGFLDVYPGFYIAFATAFFTLFKYSKVYEKKMRPLTPTV